MKGQYLAVEQVMTFGLGIMAMIALVGLFGNYKSSITGTAEDKQVDIVQSKVLDTVNEMASLPSESRGYQQVELPEEIGNQDYTMLLDDENLILRVGATDYRKNLNLPATYTFNGTAEGGAVRIYRNQENIIMRPGR